jgi:hypothetical protein
LKKKAWPMHNKSATDLDTRRDRLMHEHIHDSWEEEADDAYTGPSRFDIGFLAGCLASATRWVKSHAKTQQLPAAYFGSRTGGGC